MLLPWLSPNTVLRNCGRVLTAGGAEHLPTGVYWGPPRGAERIRPDTLSSELAPTARRRGAFHLLGY